MNNIIQTCTLSGVDHTVPFDPLFELTQRYGFIEYAVLVTNHNYTGGKCKPRYPDCSWINDFAQRVHEYNNDAYDRYDPIKVAIHVCGNLLHDQLIEDLETDNPLFDKLPLLYQVASRIQLNINGAEHRFVSVASLVRQMIADGKQVILQYNGLNDQLFDYLISDKSIDHSKLTVLIDKSRGTGIVDKNMRAATHVLDKLPDSVIGYAGGLSSSNIEQVLESVIDHHLQIARPINIDSETNLRSVMEPNDIDPDGELLDWFCMTKAEVMAIAVDQLNFKHNTVAQVQWLAKHLEKVNVDLERLTAYKSDLIKQMQETCNHPESHHKVNSDYFSGSYYDHASTTHTTICSLCDTRLSSHTEDHGYFG